MLFDRAQLEAVLPQYEVGAQLGRGGFGLVLEGRHRRLGRPVAIKILTISNEPDVERRFLAEAQVMAAFDHPHVVRVHDYAESDGLCVIVMEHLPGGALTSIITDDFPAERACAIGLAIADALDAAHARGIVHRDIKPDNVLFAADGAVKVADFGIAKLFEHATVTTGTLMGTPAYAAPEQIMQHRIGPATDVYALGGLLYHLLTGHAPFPLDLSLPQMLHYHLTQRPELPAGMPPRIAKVVGQALEKDPGVRPSSAKNFALALAGAAAADLGAGWVLRAEMPLRVNDEIRAAASATPRSGARSSSLGPNNALLPARRPAITTVGGGRHAAPDRTADRSLARSNAAVGSIGGVWASEAGTAIPAADGGVALPPQRARRRAVREAREAKEAQGELTADKRWWQSRVGLIVLAAGLIALLVISVAAGVAVGNAHRSSEISGAPAPSVTVGSAGPTALFGPSSLATSPVGK